MVTLVIEHCHFSIIHKTIDIQKLETNKFTCMHNTHTHTQANWQASFLHSYQADYYIGKKKKKTKQKQRVTFVRVNTHII